MTASTVRLKSTVRLPLASEPVKVMVYGICGVEFEVVTVNPAVPGATTEMEDGWQTGPSVSTGDTAHDSVTVGVVIAFAGSTLMVAVDDTPASTAEGVSAEGVRVKSCPKASQTDARENTENNKPNTIARTACLGFTIEWIGLN